MSDQPSLQVLYGGKDMLEALDAMREIVEAGGMDGILLIGVKTDMTLGWTYAYRDDAPMMWARLVAATATAEHELIKDGL